MKINTLFLYTWYTYIKSKHNSTELSNTSHIIPIDIMMDNYSIPWPGATYMPVYA